MVRSEGCAYGKVSRQMIVDMKETVKEMKECVLELTNHYSKRLPHWATILITLLCSLVVGLAVKLVD